VQVTAKWNQGYVVQLKEQNITLEISPSVDPIIKPICARSLYIAQHICGHTTARDCAR